MRTPIFAIAALISTAFAKSLANYRLYAYPTQGKYAGKLSEVQLYVTDDGTTEVLDVTPDFSCELTECGDEFVFSPDRGVHIRVNDKNPEFHGLVYQLDTIEDSIESMPGLRKQEGNEIETARAQTEKFSTSTTTRMIQPTPTVYYPSIERNGTMLSTNRTLSTETSESIGTAEKTESAKSEESGETSSNDTSQPTAESKETREDDKQNAANGIHETSAKALGVTLLFGIVILEWF